MKNTDTTKRLTTLEDHRDLLKESISTAKKRVVVVSPFISISAIESDKLVHLAKLAVTRGVDVRFYIDYHLNCIDGEMKLSARDGITALAKVGAKVAIVNGIHNKTIIKDNDMIAEGSFNWLSAVRIRNGECQREERTLVYSGEAAKKMIEQEIERIGRSDYAYATAQAEKVARSFTETIRTLSVVAAVLLAVLFFFSGSMKWATFGVFAIGLLPFALLAIKRDMKKQSAVGYVDQAGNSIARSTDSTDPACEETDDDRYGYLPGVRNFDGSYIKH